MISRTMKTIAQLMLILLAGIVAGYLLLTAVYALPVEPIREHVMASMPAWNGEWGKEDSYDQLVRGYETTQLDNSTDAAMMLAAIHEDGKSPFVQAAEGARYTGDSNAFQALLAMAEGEELRSASIARYWHGYLVFLKPLLLVLSYLDIRMLLMLVQGALLGAAVAGMCRKHLSRLVPAFGVSLLFITPSITGFSMQFSTALCTALIAMIVLLYMPEKRMKALGLWRFFLLAGMATSYVDYLTYPLVTLGWPLCLCLYLWPQENLLEEAKRFAACCGCWAVGYFGMWAGKWVIAGLIGGEQWFWANLLAKIEQRSSSESGGITISYLDVLMRVFRPFIKRTYLLAGAALGLGWLVKLVRSRNFPISHLRAGRSIGLCVIGVMPFAWYFATQNHSYGHAFFTSRTLAVSAFAFACLLTDMIRQQKDFPS